MITTLDYERLLDVAIEEAFAGLAEGGVPIGAAVFNLEMNLIGRGHNMRVQENDPSIHGETSAFRNGGRHPTWTDKIMVSTLSPCRYCSGLIHHFGFPIVVVGESVNSKTGGGVPWLIENGVEVVQFQSPQLVEMFGAWTAANPALWAEDGGDPIELR